ncbi:MAG TPA: hypothetical protein VMI75_32065 [Polyangiaceae bacterium]|nr:hypothetical protein [Polyangiaceae bacterium]
MSYRGLALALLCVLALTFACGGKTGGEGSDGGPGSSSSSGGGSGGGSGGSSGSSSGGVSSGSSGSSSGGEPVDATPFLDSPAPIVCMGTGGGGSSGGPPDDGDVTPCEAFQSETCSDGNSYSVDCQCPQGTCTCSQMGTGGGSSGGGISYAGCPTCSLGNLFALCGFPQ